MLPQVEFDPRYLPIINLSGETIPAFAIMKISGMDANQSLQIVKPNRDDENSGFLANEDSPIAANTAGRGRVMQPFILDTNGEGSPPAVGEIWGVENGSWFLSRDRIGYKILALGQNSTRVLVERMDSQYITDLRVTSASNATGPNLSNYYPVIERKFDSVNQTWSENGTGYLQLSNAPTVNATYTGYRDGCNMLPTYRAIQGSTTTANANGSSDTVIVELTSRTNGTFGVGWNGTIMTYSSNTGYTSSGNSTFVLQTDQRSPFFFGRKIIGKNTGVTDANLSLPVTLPQSGADVATIRVTSFNDPLWLGSIVRYSPAVAINGTMNAGNWLSEANATCIILGPGSGAYPGGIAYDINQTYTGICVGSNGTLPIYKVMDANPFYLMFGFRDDEVPFNQTQWLHRLDQYVYIRRIRVRMLSTAFNNTTLSMNITSSDGDAMSIFLNGTQPLTYDLTPPLFGGNFPSWNGQLNYNASIFATVVVNGSGNDLPKGVNVQLEVIPRLT